jgi:hypothetical protein
MGHLFVVAGLDGGYWEVEQVRDEGDFLLDEGFGIADTGEEAIVAGCGECAFTDVFFGYEKTRAGGLGAILGAIGEQGLQAGLNVGRYVDDEGGTDVGVEGCVEDFIGAMGRAGDVHLGESGGEAGFVAQG